MSQPDEHSETENELKSDQSAIAGTPKIRSWQQFQRKYLSNEYKNVDLATLKEFHPITVQQWKSEKHKNKKQNEERRRADPMKYIRALMKQHCISWELAAILFDHDVASWAYHRTHHQIRDKMGITEPPSFHAALVRYFKGSEFVPNQLKKLEAENRRLRNQLDALQPSVKKQVAKRKSIVFPLEFDEQSEPGSDLETDSQQSTGNASKSYMDKPLFIQFGQHFIVLIDGKIQVMEIKQITRKFGKPNKRVNKKHVNPGYTPSKWVQWIQFEHDGNEQYVGVNDMDFAVFCVGDYVKSKYKEYRVDDICVNFIILFDMKQRDKIKLKLRSHDDLTKIHRDYKRINQTRFAHDTKKQIDSLDLFLKSNFISWPCDDLSVDHIFASTVVLYLNYLKSNRASYETVLDGLEIFVREDLKSKARQIQSNDEWQQCIAWWVGKYSISQPCIVDLNRIRNNFYWTHPVYRIFTDIDPKVTSHTTCLKRFKHYVEMNKPMTSDMDTLSNAYNIPLKVRNYETPSAIFDRKYMQSFIHTMSKSRNLKKADQLHVDHETVPPTLTLHPRLNIDGASYADRKFTTGDNPLGLHCSMTVIATALTTDTTKPQKLSNIHVIGVVFAPEDGQLVKLAHTHWSRLIAAANRENIRVTLDGNEYLVKLEPRLFTGDHPVLTSFVGKAEGKAANWSVYLECVYTHNTHIINSWSMDKLLQHATKQKVVAFRERDRNFIENQVGLPHSKVLDRRNYGIPKDYDELKENKNDGDSSNHNTRRVKKRKRQKTARRGPQFFVCGIGILRGIPDAVEIRNFTGDDNEEYRRWYPELYGNASCVAQMEDAILAEDHMWCSLSDGQNYEICKAIAAGSPECALQSVTLKNMAGELFTKSLRFPLNYDYAQHTVRISCNGHSLSFDIASSQFNENLVPISNTIQDFLHAMQNTGKYDVILLLSATVDLVETNPTVFENIYKVFAQWKLAFCCTKSIDKITALDFRMGGQKYERFYYLSGFILTEMIKRAQDKEQRFLLRALKMLFYFTSYYLNEVKYTKFSEYESKKHSLWKLATRLFEFRLELFGEYAIKPLHIRVFKDIFVNFEHWSKVDFVADSNMIDCSVQNFERNMAVIKKEVGKNINVLHEPGVATKILNDLHYIHANSVRVDALDEHAQRVKQEMGIKVKGRPQRIDDETDTEIAIGIDDNLAEELEDEAKRQAVVAELDSVNPDIDIAVKCSQPSNRRGAMCISFHIPAARLCGVCHCVVVTRAKYGSDCRTNEGRNDIMLLHQYFTMDGNIDSRAFKGVKTRIQNKLTIPSDCEDNCKRFK